MSSLLTTENTEVTENFTERANSVEAHIIGQIQLEGAIEHYNQGNYICAITLARAAEEYLGKLLKYSTGIEPVCVPLLKSVLEETGLKKFQLNLIADKFKHFDENFDATKHNIRLEAFILIARAISNFSSFGIPFSELILDFYSNKKQSYMDDLLNSVPSSVISVSSVVNKNYPSEEDLNTLSGKIVDCAIQVHKKLGPGLLESAYQHSMAYMMAEANIPFKKEQAISVMIDHVKIDAGYRADFIIADSIILEIKSVDKLIPIHDAQLLTYMRLGHFSLGLLLNFNEQLMKNGIKRLKI